MRQGRRVHGVQRVRPVFAANFSFSVGSTMASDWHHFTPNLLTGDPRDSPRCPGCSHFYHVCDGMSPSPSEKKAKTAPKRHGRYAPLTLVEPKLSNQLATGHLSSYCIHRRCNPYCSLSVHSLIAGSVQLGYITTDQSGCTLR